VGCFRRRFRGFSCGTFSRGHLGRRAESLSTRRTEPAIRQVMRRTLRALHHRWRSHRNSENVSDYMRFIALREASSLGSRDLGPGSSQGFCLCNQLLVPIISLRFIKQYQTLCKQLLEGGGE
jgi:hypothetical protein